MKNKSRESSDPRQWERIVRIHKALQEGPVRTADLAVELEVSERTIYRDLAFMRDRLGAPIEGRPGRGHRYADPTWFLPDITMSEGELLAFMVAERVLAGLADDPMADRLRQGLAKLARHLPAEVTVDLEERAAAGFHFDPGPVRPVDRQVLDRVQSALRARRALHIRYLGLGGEEVTNRVVEPYHLKNSRGDWYLVAWCRLRQDLRTFAVSRIQSAALTDDRYQIPENFDVEGYFKNALQIFAGPEPAEVAILFTAQAARWVAERRWHPSQQLETLEDGSLVLKMQVAPTPEVVRWILSAGSQARVLSPPELVDQVRREAEEMARAYLDKASVR